MTYVNLLFFFLIALIYSSAGFGGGSLYLTILASTSAQVGFIRFTALSCNALVTSANTFSYWSKGIIQWRRVAGLLIFSTPACVLASKVELSISAFHKVLGVCLLLASVAIFLQTSLSTSYQFSQNKKVAIWLYPMAVFIGFIAGLTGIGGGVYLAPFLYFTKWGNEKEIASACSLFILVNSAAAMIGMYISDESIFHDETWYYLAAVLMGGLVGSRMVTSVLTNKGVRILTIVILIFAGLRLILK